MRLDRALLGMVSFVVIAAASEAEANVFDASFGTTPQSQGWDFLETNTGSPEPVAAGGSLFLGPTTFSGVHAFRRNDTPLDFTEGFFLTATLRIGSSTYSEPSGNRRAGYYLLAADTYGRVLSVGISSDRIFLGNDNTQNTLPSFMMNTNDFHTYSLRSQANTAVLSVDGSDVLSIDLGLSATSAANYVWFGDVSSAGSSSSETNYVAYNAVPEPGTLAALGLGAAALLRRRRRA